MTAVAIIQARLSSARLPNKVLADIAGTPMIVRVIERTLAASTVEKVVVATTTDPDDDKLVRFLEKLPCAVYRGMRDDVLDRFFRCAAGAKAAVVVRVTADDPLKDPQIIDRAVRMLASGRQLEYCSNTLVPTFPEGLDIEAFRFAALERAHFEARLPSEREHVTPYIWKHPELFAAANFTHSSDLSSWRWTVDKPRDLEFMRAVYEHFADQPLVPYQQVIAWLQENPEVLAMNAGTVRNEGYLRSIAHQDQK